MRLLWNELTPKDRYVVRIARPLSYSELGFVTQLYLPIIGVESYTLYQLLVHEVAERSGAASEHTHRGLMLMTSLPLNRLLTAREKLEALGLLEVRRRENQQRDYYYEYLVKPPLTPGQFFQDYVLSIMLLNKIENVRYQQLRSEYADQRGATLNEEYVVTDHLTKGFHEVFHSLKPSEIEVEQGSERERFITQMEQTYPPVPMQAEFEASPNHQLSIASIRVNLPSNANAEKVLNQEHIEFLYKLIHFYQVDSWSLGKELSDWTLYIQDGSLDRHALRKRLVQKYTEDKLDRAVSVATSADEELAKGKLPEFGTDTYTKICRQLSPLSVLERVFEGRIAKPSLERTESLLFDDEIPSEVVNALLLHTLQSKNMELPKAYIETVRDSWKAKQITTVEEAVRLMIDRTETRNQALEKAAKAKNGETSGTVARKNGRGTRMPQDKLPASVQRQLEREQEKAAKTVETEASQKKKTVMDDPELKALLDSLRERQRGE